MRLTLLSRDAPPHPGGIADHTAQLARHLALAGDVVTVMTRSEADPIEGCALWTHPGFDRMPPLALVDAIAASEPDALIWAYNPFSFGRRGLAFRAEAIAHELQRLSGVRRVLLAHELAYPSGVHTLKGLLWNRAQEHALTRVLAASDAVIVTTPDRAAQLAERGIAATEIPVGSNLPDLGPPSPVAADPNPFVVAHLGGVGPGRDLATLIGAMRAAADIRVLLAGDTGPLVLPADLDQRIDAPGREDPQTVAERLRAAHLYVHLDPVGPTPGRRTTLVAAMQAGLPIVAFDGDQTDQRLVDVGAVRLVPPGDPLALAGAIEALRADPAERARLGHAARGYHDDVFSWSRITDAVRRVCTAE